VNDRRELSFDRVSEEYERTRPSYPPGLLDLLPLGADAAVLDLAAGTGKLTRVLTQRYREVTAVEPLGNMRAMLERVVPGVRALEGTAERIPLDDASVDAVFAAQAFHWFDKPAALAEMARIVRPGGGAALFWNVRDEERSPFVADYHRLLERYGGAAEGKYLQAGRASGRSSTREALEAADGFGAPELHELHHELPATANGFIGMAFTASYIRALDPQAQDRFRAETLGLLARHGHRGDEPFAVPYRIDLWIARRRGP
jgi:ubiquinone/menaquinone biosynthesis C-methylase UbiE